MSETPASFTPEIEEGLKLNNIEALGQSLLQEKLNKDPEGLVLGIGKAVSEYKQRDFTKEGPATEEIPDTLTEMTPNLSRGQREKLWVRWCFRVGEQAVAPSDRENILDLLDRAEESLQKSKEPELTPFTSGSVLWMGPLKGKIADPVLDLMLQVYDASNEDNTETRQNLKELAAQVLNDKTLNVKDRDSVIKEVANVLKTQGARLDANELKGVYGKAFSPEYPPTEEGLLDYIRLQLEELTQLKDDPPPVGWAGRVIVSVGGSYPVSLHDPRFETSPIGSKAITITDKEGTRVMRFAEYLRNEVEAAEKVTREAYAYGSFKTDKGYGAVSDNSLGNEVFRNLGTIIDSTKIGSGKYLGDTIGKCFYIYKQLAEGRDVSGITYNPFTISIKDASAFQESGTRDFIASTYAGGSRYAEQLAYNLALASGFSSEGNKVGTMSGTSHTSFIDRVFHINTWRGRKEDKSGPEWTRDKDFFPPRLLLDATEMTTTEKGGVVRTIAGLLRDSGYKFRELEWGKLPEFHRKFLIGMGDAFSAFADITTFPDEVKSAETALRTVRDHFRNAWAEELFFYKASRDVTGKLTVETIDGKTRADIDRAFNKSAAVSIAVRGWVDGELKEAKRTRNFQAETNIYNAAVNNKIIPKKFFV